MITNTTPEYLKSLEEKIRLAGKDPKLIVSDFHKRPHVIVCGGPRRPGPSGPRVRGGGAKAIKKLLDEHMEGGCMMPREDSDYLSRRFRIGPDIQVPMGLEEVVEKKPVFRDYNEPIVCYAQPPVFKDKITEPSVFQIPTGEIDRPPPPGMMEVISGPRGRVRKAPPRRPPPPPRRAPPRRPVRQGGAKGAKAISNLLDQYV
jgi:hypothetical protein